MLVWFPARPQSSLYLLFPLVEAQGEDVRVDPEDVLQVHLSKTDNNFCSNNCCHYLRSIQTSYWSTLKNRKLSDPPKIIRNTWTLGPSW